MSGRVCEKCPSGTTFWPHFLATLLPLFPQAANFPAASKKSREAGRVRWHRREDSPRGWAHLNGRGGAIDTKQSKEKVREKQSDSVWAFIESGQARCSELVGKLAIGKLMIARSNEWSQSEESPPGSKWPPKDSHSSATI